MKTLENKIRLSPGTLDFLNLHKEAPSVHTKTPKYIGEDTMRPLAAEASRFPVSRQSELVGGIKAELTTMSLDVVWRREKAQGCVLSGGGG